MKKLGYILASLLVVTGLYYLNFLTSSNLTHPVWRDNATLYGSLGGAALSALLFWIHAAKPRLGAGLEGLVMAGFVVATSVTLLNARAFINAEDFDPVAIELWHKGSYAVFLTFVPAFAALLAKLRIIGSRTGQ